MTIREKIEYLRALEAIEQNLTSSRECDQREVTDLLKIIEDGTASEWDKEAVPYYKTRVEIYDDLLAYLRKKTGI